MADEKIITLDNLSTFKTKLDEKYQDKLTFDTTPTASSTNPVTSGGVYTAVSGKQDTISTTETLTFTLSDGTTKSVTVYTKE